MGFSQVSMSKTNCTKRKAASNLTIGNQTRSLIPLTQSWPPNSSHAIHHFMFLVYVQRTVQNTAVNQYKISPMAMESNKLKNKYMTGIGRMVNCTARAKSS